MPVPLVQKILKDGPGSVPHFYAGVQILAVVAVLVLAKRYFQGAVTLSERKMHGKVIIITGGTSGIGEEVVRGLASRGAQIVLLTQHPIGDPFLVDYVEDMRTQTNNELITAEQVDLTSLHSIRTFATKWIDNAPPRRLDMVVLCANTLTPKGAKLQSTEEGVEINWALNYLANFHLLSILSPALRAQPPDRDVRVIMGTCISYLGGELPGQVDKKEQDKAQIKTQKKKTGSQIQTAAAAFNASSAYASSKLALMTFAYAFQKHLSAYARPDKRPMNTRVILVDPGFTRTPGMRRYLTWGSLSGLGLYLIMYPIWWLLLKSPEMGSQTFLHAAMEAQYGRGDGPWLLKECRETVLRRSEPTDESAQKELWQHSERMIEEAEKRGARARAEGKKNNLKAEATAAKGPAAATVKQPSMQKKAARKTG